MSEAWFVVHRHDLWDVSKHIIGFWDKRANYDRISIDDKIIYYRAGPKGTGQPGEIIGIFRVVKKDENLCSDFSSNFVKSQSGNKKYLKWQCELERVKEAKMPKKEIDNLNNQLSFYNDWVDHFHGGRSKQVFPATQGDITLISNKR